MEAAKASPVDGGFRLREEVSTPKSFTWEPSRATWTIPNPCRPARTATTRSLEPNRSHRIVAFDFGVKYNILRQLRQNGFEVEVVNSRYLRGGRPRPRSRRHLPLQRPRRPRRPRLHSRRDQATDRSQAHLWHLSWAPDSLPRIRRQDLQAEVRSPRRQPARQRSPERRGSRLLPRTTDSRRMPRRCPAHVEVTHLNLNDDTVEGIRSTQDPGLLRPVPPGSGSGSPRCELLLPRVR